MLGENNYEIEVDVSEADIAKIKINDPAAITLDAFGESEAVGQRIKIKKHTFEVIGVMKERGTVAFQDYDDQILLPIKTMQKLIAGVNHLGLIRAKVDDENNIQRAINDVEITLRERHDITDMSGASDDFTVRSAAEALDVITTVTDALRYFLAAMAALSLLVGGIGIMNIMLVSVTERTREIGLRKAVGATYSDIMLQFLIEAVLITVAGGITGVIFGAAISYLISVGASSYGLDWRFSIPPKALIISLSFSAFFGILFGVYPARRAARLNPIEALQARE
ncbi:FtsX-like permease family protein [Patescibacteria group bacterium]|nr:FtsX-like permease family protein [Patescibacteria group bacterium]MBU4455538.1 FtsX-like permease family protein [Patescibacteria group bacterium]